MEIEIIIPETWHDVKLPQYTAFQKAIKPYEGEEEFIDKVIDHAVYHLCGVSADILHKLPTETFLTIQSGVLKLITSDRNEVLVKSFTLGDSKYGFMPSLDDMTYGEYIDLVQFSKDTWNNIPELLSILYRPIVKESGDTYEIQTYNATNLNQVELFREKLTMDIVFGALSFFLHLQQDLLRGTLTSSIWTTLKKMTKEDKAEINRVLTESGVSIQQLQSLLTTILPSSTQSPN